MIAENVVRLLTAQGKKLALAESCTGGRIASLVTDVPGASEVFTHGYVTYANEAKRDMLGVPMDPIEAHGAVSEEVAIAMAEGALKNAGADMAVSVTGIAGPSGGSEEKPVGTVWIGLATAGKSFAVRKNHPEGREVFKQATSRDALGLVEKALLAL